MSKGFLTIGVILLAVMALVLIGVITNTTTGSELDHYLVKEATNAAMDDAIDITYYREHGVIRMDAEKFVENFLVRFANSVDATRNYRVGFYDINETPPKVSVKVESSTAISFNKESILLTETYDGIVENNYFTDQYVENQIAKGY